MTDRLKLLADFLRTSEGYSLKVYDDGGGVPTIGIGHTGYGVTFGMAPWTDAQVMAAFARDMDRFIKLVTDTAQYPTPNQHVAMTSLVFNIGPGWTGTAKPRGAKDGFRQSSVLRLHNVRDFAGAADAFALWKYDNGVIVPGLVKRRRLEADLYRGTQVEDLSQMIRNMQMALNTAGIRPALIVDGHWGAKTDIALEKFQQAHRLETSGDLDEPTATALGV